MTRDILHTDRDIRVANGFVIISICEDSFLKIYGSKEF